MNRREIKKISKIQLNRNGNWKLPVLLTALGLMISWFFQGEEGLFLSIAATIVTSLINIYFVKSCLQIAKSEENEKIEWSDIMITGNMFIKCILYSVIISLLVTVITLGLVLVGGTVFTAIPILSVSIWIVALLVGWIISIYAAFSIFVILDKDADIFEAFKISVSLVKGRFWKMIIFSLSFIWWYLLGIVTLGIGMFWVMPYMTISFCNYYFEIYSSEDN